MSITAGTERDQGAGAPETVAKTPAPTTRNGGIPAPRPGGGPGEGQLERRSPIAVARFVRPVADRYWGTLTNRLRLIRAACLLLGGGLVILLSVAATGLSGTWDEMTQRDAPRTVAATQLNLALNDMDAQSANILLSSGDSGTGKGRLVESYTKANGFYTGAQQTISSSLRTLGAASEGDKATEDTVVKLTDDFAHYQELIGRALADDRHLGGKDAARDDYRSASSLLQSQLLPDARKLVDANNAVFNQQYEGTRDRIDAELYTEVALGVLLIAVMAGLQIHLARRFRRVFNPGLVAATLCAAIAMVCGIQLLSGSLDWLKDARRDSFDSVVALSRAKAIAYDANADESRYLLVPGDRAAYEKTFFDKSQQLYGIEGASLGTYDAKLAETWAAYTADHEDKRFTGEFRRELDNITFTGERDAAEKVVESYAVYQRDDRTIRRMVTEGKDKEAIVYCIGWDTGTSNAHFGQWMTDLDKLTEINTGHFDQAVNEGRGVLHTQAPVSGAALLLAAGLSVLGLRPRLAEFR